MINRLKLSASAAALGLLVAGAVSSAQAADVNAGGCSISGAAGVGYMFDWQKDAFEAFGESIDGDVDWDTPFGEAGGLVTCGGFNVQADFAYYDHSTEIDAPAMGPFGGGGDKDAANSHVGGALFWRDPSFAALGVSASWINQDLVGKDADALRVGVFGEFFLENVTLGASVYYFNGEKIDMMSGNLQHDGFELAAYARYYATPDLSLMVRGDGLISKVDFSGVPNDADIDGWAISGEAEYLAWDKGLSVFGGLRYAERTLDMDSMGPFASLDVDDTQVYAGLKFYFGQDGSLMDRQRTGLIDNTSTFKEKLPNILTSAIAGYADAVGSNP